MSLDFLLEIGTEEIPHWMIPGALAQLQKLDLLGATPSVDATPRRLVVRASDIPPRTPDREETVKGPPVASGEKAAAGFARKQGVDPSEVKVVGNYYELVKRVPGRAAAEILAESLPSAILGLQWPKTMYWTGGKTGPRFIRPIRWIVALLGDDVIPFEIAGVRSNTITRGHRILGSSSIPVTTANYEASLGWNFVILSAGERRHRIETGASKLGAKMDADLLETLTFITEYPTAIRGDFDPAYLELPAEVLTTVMRHHQKYFAVESAPGQLAPHFVAIMNTSGDPDGIVKRGNERVLRARFNDARFFWNVDQQKKLVDRGDDLAHVTFQAKLGSYLEKTNRVVELVKELGGNAHAQRAAELSKCDLTTEMVKEFTDLQGIVGGLYAKAQGEPEEVSRAIYEHYQPLSMEDSIPETLEGQIVALADKLDTLSECFRVGLAPTGSKDPYGLRRAAQGVIRIISEAPLSYGLDSLFYLMGPDPSRVDLYHFLRERAQYYFEAVRGYKYDRVNAVLRREPAAEREESANSPTLPEAGMALQAVEESAELGQLVACYKRVRKIVSQANLTDYGTLHEGLLEAGAERDLYLATERIRPEMRRISYAERMKALASLLPEVDTFFDKVLVNAPDPAVRTNRLTLLYRLQKQFETIADFSEIVTSGEQKQ